MKKFIAFLFYLGLANSYAQDKATYYGLKGHYGFIIAHSSELKPISQTNPFGLQLEYSKLRSSDNAWKTCHCYGRSGFSFAYFNYANPDVLGSSYNLIYFVEPYFTYKGPLKFSLRGSIGATYLDTIYDEENNPENLLFSTHLSFFLGLSLNLNYQLSDNYAINLSANYNHISNGGQKQPNKGMNFPTVSVGIDKIIDHTPLQKKPDSLRFYNPSLSYYMGAFGSLRSSDREAEATNHPLIGITAGGLKPLSGINGINAGVELWYDYSDKKIAENIEVDDSAFSSAINLGHHFHFGNFYFLQQFGIYVTRPKNIQPKWLYQRYSFWYKLHKNWAIGASMIAYGHVADHMDGRLMYILD
ncbi:acyloxyacyl hydrolase [Aquimarina brevivitae]|uniref:Lipid A 3-O-deacylase PagL n=1 Tax=Aquimarina brevivitae TaxID=323412 RepID=A0A4Q7P0I2_9FLAO|nr:acyloxyacyl hydrolase [Aquimarina brevivitae]RZS93185.1 lipid A 3-O-deacylase PagL [Aquimarina brevivitae]